MNNINKSSSNKRENVLGNIGKPVELSRIDIDNSLEDFLGDRLTLSALYLARRKLQERQKLSQRIVGDNGEGSVSSQTSEAETGMETMMTKDFTHDRGVKEGVMLKEEVEFLRSNRDYVRLTSSLKRQTRQKAQTTTVGGESNWQTDKNEIEATEKRQMPPPLQSFSFFDKLPKPIMPADRITIRDILQFDTAGDSSIIQEERPVRRNSSSGKDGTKTGSATDAPSKLMREQGNWKAVFDRCQKVENIQDLLLDFETKNEDIEALAKLLFSALSYEESLHTSHSSSAIPISDHQRKTATIPHSSSTEPNTDQWLDLHYKWYKQCEENTSFAIHLLRNVVLLQHMRSSSASSRSRFAKKRKVGPVVAVLYKMLSLPLKPQLPSKEWYDLMLLLMVSSFRNYGGNDDDDVSSSNNNSSNREGTKASVEVGRRKTLLDCPRTHWAYLDPCGVLFTKLVSSLESPSELAKIVRYSGILENIMEVLNFKESVGKMDLERNKTHRTEKDAESTTGVVKGTKDNSGTIESMDAVDLHYATVLRSLSILRTLVLQLFSIHTFPYPNPHPSNAAVTSPSPTFPTTPEQIEHYIVSLEQTAHRLSSSSSSLERMTMPHSNISDVRNILRPFQSVLAAAVVTSTTVAIDSNLVQMCEEAAERILIGCVREIGSWKELMLGFVTDISRRIINGSVNAGGENGGEVFSLSVAMVSFYRICRRVIASVLWGEIAEIDYVTYPLNADSEPSSYEVTTRLFPWMVLINSLQTLLDTLSRNSGGVTSWSELNDIMGLLVPILHSSIATRLFGREQIYQLLETFTTLVRSDVLVGKSAYIPLTSTVEGMSMLVDLGLTEDLTSYLLDKIWTGCDTLTFGDWTGRCRTLLNNICGTKKNCLALLRSDELPRLYLCQIVYPSKASSRLKFCSSTVSTLSLVSGWLFVSSVRTGFSDDEVEKLKEDLLWGLHTSFDRFFPYLEALMSNLDALIFGVFDECERFTKELDAYLALPSNAAVLDEEERARGDVCQYMLSALVGSLGSSPCLSVMNISARSDMNSSGIASRGISQEASFWDACKRLTQDTYSTYTVEDVVQCFSYLVENVAPQTNLTVPSTSNNEFDERYGYLVCVVKRFLASCFKWHGLPPITHSQNDCAKLDDIIVHQGIDGDAITINWSNVCILALCKSDTERTSLMIDAFSRRYDDFFLGPDSSYISPLIKEINYLLEIECPEIQPAMEILDTNLSSIVGLWLRQSYVSVLSFEDAILFNIIVVEHGYEYVVYMTVAMIQYLQNTIFEYASYRMQKNQSALVILTRQLGKFRVACHVDYANDLRRRHPITISKANSL